MSDEEPKKKDKDFLGIPSSDLGTYGIVLGAIGAVLGLGALAYPLLKPQIDKAQGDMQARQAYQQHMQLQAMQAQQAQAQAQTAYPPEPYPGEGQGQPVQPEPSQTPVIDPRYAVETDPMVRGPRRTRIPEVEATETSGADRFNNISV